MQSTFLRNIIVQKRFSVLVYKMFILLFTTRQYTINYGTHNNTWAQFHFFNFTLTASIKQKCTLAKIFGIAFEKAFFFLSLLF